MKEDHDLLDNALDAAEAQFEKEGRATEAQSEPLEKEPIEPVTIDNKPSLSRDKSGKFAKTAKGKEETDLSDQSTEDVSVEAEAEAPEGTAEPINVPHFWSAELKAAAAEAPRALVDKFIAHDAQREQWARQQVENARKVAPKADYYADFSSPQEAEIYKAELRAQGINDEREELFRYRAWDRVLKNDVLGAVNKLLTQNGYAPYSETEGSDPQSQYQDPRVDDALRRAEAAEKRIAEWEDNQRKDAIRREVHAFKQGKDSSGEVRERFATFYGPQIDHAYNQISAIPEYSHLTVQEKLHYAYEYVKSEVYGQQPQPEQAKPAKSMDQKIAEAKKAQAAASRTTGAPRTGAENRKPSLKGKDFKEKFDSAFDSAYDRVAS